MAPTAIKNLLTAFSPSGDYLAISAGDGRVKTWDTVNGLVRGEFADITVSTSGADSAAREVDGHLSVDYSCMTWNPVLTKGKKKSGKHGLSSLLALGTGTGDVLLWDTAVGRLKWRAKDCHPGGVRSLAFAKFGSILYSAGADGMVCEFDVSSGQLLEKFRASKRAVSCIAVSADGSNLVAGCAELRLFDLSSKRRMRKFTGHPDAVKALVYTDDGQHFISSAIGERHVAVWQSDGSKHDGAAACVLSMEHPAVSIHCSGGFADSLRVLAVSEAGVAYIWHASSLEDLSKVKPIKISVAHSKSEASPSGKSGKSSRSAVLAARLMGKVEKGPGSVLVAYGTTVKPLFDRISLEGQGNSIVLHAGQNGALLPTAQVGSTAGIKVFQEATVLGPDNTVDAVEPRPHVEFEDILPASKASSKKKRRASNDLDADLQHIDIDRPKLTGAEKGEPDEAALDEHEETMEEKLRALGIVEDAGTKETADGNKAMSPPKADSLQVLMSQALQSDDNTLLEQCLSVSDEKVIVNTIRRLRPSDAAKFLQVSVYKIEARPKRGLMLVPWIKAVLLNHAAYIMSNPAMQSVLSSLYQVIDARLSVFRPLLSLSGRLDLIMAQISTNEGSTGADEVEAAVVYEESDDDLEGDVEDVMDDDMEETGSDDSAAEDLVAAEEDDMVVEPKRDGFIDAKSDESDEDDL